MKTKRKNKIILIKLDKDLYDLKAVKAAVSAYQNLADISLKQKRSHIELSLKNIGKDAEKVIKDEFCNYVLSLNKF